MEKLKIKKLLSNFIALSLGIFFTFLLLEVFLRIYDPFQFRVRGDKIVLPANRQYRIENNKIKGLDKTIVHTKNSLGFRGEEPPKDFKNYFTVITVGGSTTECFYISDGKTWTDIVGKKLSNYLDRFWINNAGLDGHTTFGHLMLLKDYIIKLKPNAILFLIGGNDMVGIETMGDYEERGMKDDTDSNNDIKRFLKLSAKYSRAADSLINIYRVYKARFQGIGHGEIDLKEMGKMELSESEKKILIEKHREKHIKSFELRLKMLIQISKENGIEPILITHPSLLGKGVDDVTGVDLARIKINDIDGELFWDTLELYNDVTRVIGKNEDIFVIDLAREMPKSSRYYYDFGHFTNEGAEKVADIVLKELYPFLAKRYASHLRKL